MTESERLQYAKETGAMEFRFFSPMVPLFLIDKPDELNILKKFVKMTLEESEPNRNELKRFLSEMLKEL